MDDRPRCLVTAKLAKFTTKIGFPDKWKDHSRLSFEPSDDILALRRKVAAFELQSEFYEKLNTPKDKTKWEMHPHQVPTRHAAATWPPCSRRAAQVNATQSPRAKGERHAACLRHR